ncbi:MAG: hypothetical protein IJ699_07875 [Bacteroidaceae bacterium]|nr:hypothetical protein [Bacteroidaceae bacterium]
MPPKKEGRGRWTERKGKADEKRKGLSDGGSLFMMIGLKTGLLMKLAIGLLMKLAIGLMTKLAIRYVEPENQPADWFKNSGGAYSARKLARLAGWKFLM